MEAEKPHTRLSRSRKISVAFYGFVHTSGVGFGSAIKTSKGVVYRYGLWGCDAVEEGVESGELHGAELFIFKDNSAEEGAYYKGNTDSRLLFDLILHLSVLDMKAALMLHIVHIAGTRMIMQGVDALYRGDQAEGVMAGKDMPQYIPLHLTALERSPAVVQWVESWVPQVKDLVLLSVEDWFERGHGRLGGSKNKEGI